MIRNYSDHAANERTFLSWVRSVIAVEGFGIAAARLGDSPAQAWTEAALLGAGALVIALAFVRLHRTRRRIDADTPEEAPGTSGDALLMLAVAALFVLILIFGLHVL
jgi:putative membrane protein